MAARASEESHRAFEGRLAAGHLRTTEEVYSPAKRSGGGVRATGARRGWAPRAAWAGELRVGADLERAQAVLLARDVVAGHRCDALALGDLDLEVHHILLAERHFGGGEIELPHAHEAPVVNALYVLAVGEEALAPSLQRLCIMQAQDFDVGHQQPGAFDVRHDLGQGWDVAAREDVFGDPRIGGARTFTAAEC